MYRICPIIRRYVVTTTKEWKNEMWLDHTYRYVKTGTVAIKRRIFKGDSLSYVYWTVHHCDSWRIRDQNTNRAVSLGDPTVAVDRPILEFPRGQGRNGSDSQVGGFRGYLGISRVKEHLWVQWVTNCITNLTVNSVVYYIQVVTGGTDQTSGGCSLC